MGTVVQNVSVRVTANTQGLSRGFKKAEGQTKGFKSALSNIGGPLGRIAGSVGRLGAVGAVFAGMAAAATGAALAIRKTVVEIDEIAKTASKLGATTEGISALGLGAELSGVGVNTMNMALQRMTRRMSEAAMGTGEAKAAIKELGLDAQQLAKMTPTAALREVADAMQKVENPSDKLRLAFKLFDSEGVAVINTLKGGSAGLDEFRKKADELGILIDAKGARQVEAASDAFVEFKASLSGVATQLTIALAPALEVGAKFLTDFVKIGVKAAKFFRKFTDFLFGVKPAAEDAEESVEKFQAQAANTEAINKMVDGLKQQVELFGLTGGAAVEAKAKMKGATDEQIEQIKKLGAELKQLSVAAAQDKVIEGLRQQITLFGKTAEQAAALKAQMAGASQSQVQSIRRLTAELEGLKGAQQAATDAQKTRQQLMQRGMALQQAVLSPLEKHRAALRDLNSLHRAGAIDSLTLGRQIAKSRDELMKFQNQAAQSTGILLKGSVKTDEFIAQARRDEERRKALLEGVQGDLGMIGRRRAAASPAPTFRDAIGPRPADIGIDPTKLRKIDQDRNKRLDEIAEASRQTAEAVDRLVALLTVQIRPKVFSV